MEIKARLVKSPPVVQPPDMVVVEMPYRTACALHALFMTVGGGQDGPRGDIDQLREQLENVIWQNSDVSGRVPLHDWVIPGAVYFLDEWPRPLMTE